MADLSTVDKIVLFDGVCNLCNNTVQFLIRRDRKGVLKFASLQSDIGQSILEKHHLNNQNIDSIVFVENNQIYYFSDAPLRIVRYLGGAWWILGSLRIVPRVVRDGVYKWIARHRYRWFGKQAHCILPRAEWKNRFL